MNEFKILRGKGKSGNDYYKVQLVVDGKAIKQDIFVDGVIAQVAELLGAKIYEVGAEDDEEE